MMVTAQTFAMFVLPAIVLGGSLGIAGISALIIRLARPKPRAADVQDEQRHYG